MITQPEMYDLIRGIVVDVMPEEEFFLEAEGENIIADIYAGKKASGAAAFQGLEIAKSTLDLIQVINGTIGSISALFTIFKAAQPKSRNELTDKIKHRWRDELIAAGVSPRKATLIVERHADDVAILLERK